MTQKDHIHAAEPKRARNLKQKRLLHASLVVWREVVKQACGHAEAQAAGQYGLGVVLLLLGRYSEAVEQFEQAAEGSRDFHARRKYLAHLAIAHARLYENDRALRVMREAIELYAADDAPGLAPAYGNLSYIQGQNGFVKDALTSAFRSLGLYQKLSEEGLHASPAFAEVYNNIGFFSLEDGQFEQAETYLRKAIDNSEGSEALSPLMEMSRLFFMQGNMEAAIDYGAQAVRLVWASIVNYNKEDIARLCRLLASLSYAMGERTTAARLLEKSQLMFGQLGMWRDWEQTQTQMDEWQRGGDRARPTPGTPQPRGPMNVTSTYQPIDLREFLTLLDVMNAQEMLHPQFSALLDARVLYAEAFADELGMSEGDTSALIYACRFADYGVAALEPEVLENPTRSRCAWEQYTQHPELSVDMLKSLHLSGGIEQVILHHHEHYDGTGFPRQVAGEAINYLARVFAIVGYYARGVVLDGKRHDEVLADIRTDNGHRFDPLLARTFVQMFDVSAE